MRTKPWLVVGILALVACGPSSRNSGHGDDDGRDGANGSCSPENTPAACSDGVDNDCDGEVDCADPDCSGVGSCPVCGQVDNPLSSPLVLPDGACGTNDNGNCSCTTDANCANIQPAGQHCFTIGAGDLECRASYIAKLHYMSFGANQVFQDGDLTSVCVVMEHSWVRDLEIQLVAPSGQIVQLQKFLGQTGSEIYLGKANDCDTDANPVPGVGAMYCWSPTATKPDMLNYANGGGTMASVIGCDGESHVEMPPDTYSAADPWSNLNGAMMNGDWELRVTDLWPEDNGYIFSWSITWNINAIQDCTGPIIL